MKNHEDVSRLIMREINDIVYVADIETYELLFLNQSAIELLGNPATSEWRSKPCHKILQNCDEPCSFCNNAGLGTNEFLCWEHYNEMLERHFIVKDKLVEWDGRLVRLEIAVDNTDKEKIYQQLKKNLLTERTLVSCIETLSTNSGLTAAINNLLEIIGNYYQGDRAYIFECDYEERLLVNTYEWCKEGVETQIENLKELPLEAADRWMEEFRKKGEFYITCLGENVDKSSAEYQILEPQGVESLMAAPLLDEGKIIGFIGVDNPGVNITEMVLLQSVAFFVMDDIKKKKLTKQLQELSYTDTLTGIWNRNKYMEQLYQYEKEPPAGLGIIYADINGLKRANDVHGHQFGDYLICHTAEVFSSLFPGSVYRIGGDEFIVLCTSLSHDEFYRKVDRLYVIVQRDEDCSVSIGVKWTEEKEDVNKQIVFVDEQMYAEKQRYYSKFHTGECSHKTGLSMQLVKEIKEGKFTVYLQPQVKLKTGELHGAEALIRKKDNRGGMETPIQFIPRYEVEGIIRHVDLFVLEQVCQLLARWQKLGNTDLKIAVNLSRLTLMEYRIADELKEICNRYHVPAEQIAIEVTETMGHMDRIELEGLMKSLKKAGFTISLDDFGAEYSNLSILTSLRFDEIKLDKSLIDKIDSANRSKIIVSHAIEMCRELDVMNSVAEGIETREQLHELKTLKCNVGQGYFFDKPLTVDVFEKKYVQIEGR